jgi:hypothetical protein
MCRQEYGLHATPFMELYVHVSFCNVDLQHENVVWQYSQIFMDPFVYFVRLDAWTVYLESAYDRVLAIVCQIEAHTYSVTPQAGCPAGWL